MKTHLHNLPMAAALRMSALVTLIIHSFAAAQPQSAPPGTWSGTVINSTCTVDDAFAERQECTAPNIPGAKLALFDDTIRQIYLLEPQESAAGHLGDAVTVTGTLEGATLHVASLEKFGPVGLPIRTRAPAFSALDQFGHEQTLESLKGPKGTVLLFFRSADW